MSVLAVFDLDGTLTVGDSHARIVLGLLRDPEVPPIVKAETVVGSLVYLAGLLPNAWTKRVVARAWQGRERAAQAVRMERFCEERVLPDLSPAASARLREHQDRGHRVLLLSASLGLMVEPVARALGIGDHRAVDLAVDPRGRLLPALAGPCFHGQEKARWLAAWASAEGIDLGRAWGYGNSFSDRYFLALLGHPVAVGPDPLLRRHARRAGWTILAHAESSSP